MSLRLRTAILASFDLVLVVAAYRLALTLRFGENVPVGAPKAFWPVVAGAAALTVVMLGVYDTYGDLYRPFLDTLAALAVATALAGAPALALPYALRLEAFPRSIFMIALPLQLALLALNRVPWVVAERRRLSRQRIVLVGNDPGLAEQIAVAVREQMAAETVITLNNPSTGRLAAETPDMVVMAPDLDPALREQLHTWCAFNRVTCLVVPRLEDMLFARSRVGHVGDFPTLEARRPALSPDHAVLKRLIDVMAALALGIITLPVSLLCSAAIKLTDPDAPVLYRQTRVGLRGRLFTLYKFRTMIPDAEAQTGPVLARDGDPRVTPVGRILRATRLDELPQLWNVLRGDMSLVGPRPERPEFVEEFVSKTPLYALRHNVRPGLTGLAQILGRYNSDYRDKLRYDLLYVAYASPMLDLKILLQTVRVVLLPPGVMRLEHMVPRRWVALRGE